MSGIAAFTQLRVALDRLLRERPGELVCTTVRGLAHVVETDGAERLARRSSFQQHPAVAAGCTTGSPLLSGWLVTTALMIAPCIPSAT